MKKRKEEKTKQIYKRKSKKLTCLTQVCDIPLFLTMKLQVTLEKRIILIKRKKGGAILKYFTE